MLAKHMRKIRDMLVLYTIGRLEDSFDIEDTSRCAATHNRITIKIADKLPEIFKSTIVLGAGDCQICETFKKRLYVSA